MHIRNEQTRRPSWVRRLTSCAAGLAACALLAAGGCAGRTASQAPAVEARAAESPAPAPVPEAPAMTAAAPLPGPLSDKDLQVLAAIRSMTRLGGEASTHLAQLARTKDLNIRLAAVQTLGAIPDPRVIPPLIQALGDSNDQVRETAVLGLILREDQLTREHVAQLLDIVRHGKAGWPDPASDYTIYINHYAGKALVRAQSPFITPEIAAEADEALMRY